MTTARFLLDTNTLIFLSRRHAKVVARLMQVPLARCVISSVSVFELFTGAEKSDRPSLERAKVRSLLRRFEVLPFTGPHGEHAGRIRAELERRGRVIGPYDLQIAAQAVVQRLTLVTNNMREFRRVSGLRLADWFV
jgi:tRNA(fMet)-specific endonuclease VapC